MLKIAITGNIASGKSVAEKFLEKKGFCILDTDVLAHQLLVEQEIKAEIIRKFSESDILENNEISRIKLGKIVFADENKKAQLEAILHPIIKNRILDFFKNCEDKNEKVAFVSVPLLYETGFEKIFDKVILIYAEDEIRLKRLMERNGIMLQDAKNRMDKQISQDEKTSLANFVIYNNSTEKEFLLFFSNIIDEII